MGLTFEWLEPIPSRYVDPEEAAVGLRIAEAAERSGIPATTIRYYEDEGLVRPADREPNGYRTYDDRDVARLRFVARARALGLPTDSLRELVDLWDRDRCGPVADRLRDRLRDRLAETQQRITDLLALADDLQEVLAGLEQSPRHDGPCSDDCACIDPEPANDHDHRLPLLQDGGDGWC